MNEKIEQYIKDLPPEMQEKARQCKTMEELNDFIAENDIEIPEDALEMVSGGGCGNEEKPKEPHCKYCGNTVGECAIMGGVTPRGIESNIKPYYCTVCPRALDNDEVEWR